MVADGWLGGSKLGNKLQLCPVEGAVFACGSEKLAVLRDQGFVRDPALEAGLPGGRFIQTIVGKWPESAWLLYSNPGNGNWSFAVYRWKSTRWERALDVPQGMVTLGVQLVAWKGGALARIEESDPSGAKATAKMVPLDASGPLPDFPLPLASPSTCKSWPQNTRLMSTPSGDLVGVGATCDGKRALVAHWPSGGKTPTVKDLPACSDGTAPVADPTPLQTGFGVVGWCDNTPYVAVSDGTGWSKVDVTGLVGKAVGYTRNASGEYLVVREDAKARLLLRTTGGWGNVALPFSKSGPDACPTPPFGDPATDPKEPRRIFPMSVWTVGADTWVTGVTTREDCRDGNAGVVLRSSPVREPFHLK